MRFLKNILAAALMAATAWHAQAQQLPSDPELRTGKLPNGLTYYIRQNVNEKGIADFYIVHNVGALQEDDNQDGLAHFLEHMAFNGLKHYPKKTMLEFLGKNGVRFGANVNAFTSRKETCYHIDKVPLVRDSFVDSVLMVLHDWSHDILCENDELDAERGVIREEWRRSNDAKRRVFNAQTGIVYQGAKPAKRSVLGSLDVINNFKREDILGFYHKWYRPDLQAIIIVGDIDAPAMEAKVRNMFSDIPAAQNPAPKERYLAPEAHCPIFQNYIDSTISFFALKAFYRQPFPSVRSDESFWKDRFCREMVSSIMSTRMRQQIETPDSPIKSAVLVTYPESSDYYVSLFTILGKKGADQKEVFRFCERNVESVLQHGVSQDEVDAAKLQEAQRWHLDRPKLASATKNSEYVAVFHDNFTGGYATTTPVQMHDIQKKILGSITMDDVRQSIDKMFKDSDAIYSWFGKPEDEPKIPSADEVKAIIAEIEGSAVAPGYASIKKVDLSVTAPEGTLGKAGKRISQLPETKIWKLDNGITVYYTPVREASVTPALSLAMYFNTGYEAFPQDKIAESEYASTLIRQYSGIRGVLNDGLSKDAGLSGVSRMLRIQRNSASIMISAPKDKAENAFRLASLSVTDPYVIDGNSVAINRKRTLESLGEEKKDAARFNEISDSLLYAGHPWLCNIDSADVLSADSSFVKEIYSREYGRLKGMEAYLASNLPEAEIEEYVRKYLSSIAVPEYSWKIADAKPYLATFKGSQEFSMTGKKIMNPYTVVYKLYKSKIKVSARNLAAVDFADYILSQRLLNQIREERGGTYTISFSTAVSEREGGYSESEISFKTRPELAQTLIGDMDGIVEKFCSEGPTEKELDEARTYLVKRQRERDAVKRESMPRINSEAINFVRNKVDPSIDHVKAYEEVGSKEVRKIAGRLTGKDCYTMTYTEE